MNKGKAILDILQIKMETKQTKIGVCRYSQNLEQKVSLVNINYKRSKYLTKLYNLKLNH